MLTSQPAAMVMSDRSVHLTALCELFIVIVALGLTYITSNVIWHWPKQFSKIKNFSKLSPFKCIRKQICQVNLESSLNKLGTCRTQILNSTYQVPRPPAIWFWRRWFWLSVLLYMYGHGAHIGHVTKTISTNFRFSIPRSRHMKTEFSWPSGSREDVEHVGVRTEDERQSHWYSINSPMNLRARWAKIPKSRTLVPML